ncbi:hypothetical protein QJQ45_008435 [Haematococcus lacustris]|nr:hypothetical protein QJQ45_008435 [Haematococcus lacustris]
MYLNLAQWRPSRVRDRSAALVARVRQDGCRKVVIKCESAVGPSDVVHDRVLGHHPKKTPTNVPPSLDSGSSATTPPIDSRPVPASSNVSGHTQTHPLVMSTSDGSVAHASLPAEEQHHGVQEATPIVSSLMVTIEGEISEAVFRDNSPQGTAPLQTDAREPLLSSDSGSTPDQDKNIRLTHGVPDPRRYSMEDFIVSEQASLKSRSQLSMRSGSQANSFDQGGAKASSGSSCDKARSDSNPAQGSAKASSGSNRDEQCASVSSGSPGRDSWARLRPLNPQSWQPRRAFMMPLLDVQPWAGRHSPTSYLNLVQHIEQQVLLHPDPLVQQQQGGQQQGQQQQQLGWQQARGQQQQPGTPLQQQAPGRRQHQLTAMPASNWPLMLSLRREDQGQSSRSRPAAAEQEPVLAWYACDSSGSQRASRLQRSSLAVTQKEKAPSASARPSQGAAVGSTDTGLTRPTLTLAPAQLQLQPPQQQWQGQSLLPGTGPRRQGAAWLPAKLSILRSGAAELGRHSRPDLLQLVLVPLLLLALFRMLTSPPFCFLTPSHDPSPTPWGPRDEANTRPVKGMPEDSDSDILDRDEALQPDLTEAERNRKVAGEARAARDRDNTYHGRKCKLAHLIDHLPQELWDAFLADAVQPRVEACSERAVLASLLLGLLVRGLFTVHVADPLGLHDQPVYTDIPVPQAAIPDLSCRNLFLQLCRGLPGAGANRRPSAAVAAVLAAHPDLRDRLAAIPRHPSDGNMVDHIGKQLETAFSNMLTLLFVGRLKKSVSLAGAKVLLGTNEHQRNLSEALPGEPPESFRFCDRDVSAALDIRRCAVGPGPRPTELCYWGGRPAMPKPCQPGQEWVYLRDKALLRKWRRKWRQ